MLGTFVKNAQLNRLKNIGTTALATHWFSLHSANPFDTGASEVTTTYASGRATYTAANYTASTGTISRDIENTANISFGAAIASGTAPYWGVWTAETGGTFMLGGKFQTALGADAPLSFATGENIEIAANTLFIKIPINAFSSYEVDNLIAFIKGTNLTGLANLYSRLVTSTGEISTGSRLTLPAATWTDISVASNVSEISNAARINYADASVDIPQITGLGFWDASTAGNLIATSVRSPVDIVAGQKLFVTANKLKFKIS